MADGAGAIAWWVHPLLAGSAVALAGLAVHLGRKSAKAATDQYPPILRLHIAAALSSITLAVTAAFIGILVVDETKVIEEFDTPHAFVGVAAAALWAVQGVLGLTLWYEKDRVRKTHRINGFLVVMLGAVQLPLGYALAVHFL